MLIIAPNNYDIAISRNSVLHDVAEFVNNSNDFLVERDLMAQGCKVKLVEHIICAA